MRIHNLSLLGSLPRLNLALALLLAAATAQADAQVSDSANRNASSSVAVDNSERQANHRSVDNRVDNSVRAVRDQRLALTRQYLMDQQYRSNRQRVDEDRDYGSAVGQGAGNHGRAHGHELGQQQGGVSVGSLVSESGRDGGDGQRGGVNWQYAPQSNTLMMGGDNYAPIQLSNINANGGNIHIGDVNKGNLYNSQIGNNQQGSQGGDSTNAQSNSQHQQADSRTGSQDSISN